ncbi:hypothetical protein HDF23_004351 [Mucilaginibacter lappiensis]|uniref:Uncharacterized protein n=1 Tax=Mucilaginibacter lappiensis TaxID=354630 RepID=A0ABR6PPB1_9SPHI|nr:hypothetical protein [Mucilaginibacter lappiensis]
MIKTVVYQSSPKINSITIALFLTTLAILSTKQVQTFS